MLCKQRFTRLIPDLTCLKFLSQTYLVQILPRTALFSSPGLESSVWRPVSGFCSYFELTCSQKRKIPAPALNLISPFSKISRSPRRGMLQTISPWPTSSPAANTDTMIQHCGELNVWPLLLYFSTLTCSHAWNTSERTPSRLLINDCLYRIGSNVSWLPRVSQFINLVTVIWLTVTLFFFFFNFLAGLFRAVRCSTHMEQ